MTATSMGYLINKNRDVFFYSPICHFSTIADECNLPHDKDFWWDVNEHMLNISDEMYILNIPGWELSKGIHQETDHCKENNIPVYLIEWNTGNIIIEL